jgi:hypothetical protein
MTTLASSTLAISDALLGHRIAVARRHQDHLEDDDDMKGLGAITFCM